MHINLFYGFGFEGFLYTFHVIAGLYMVKGLLQGGEGWLLDEPKESLDFILVDSRNDVWIGSCI